MGLKPVGTRYSTLMFACLSSLIGAELAGAVDINLLKSQAHIGGGILVHQDKQPQLPASLNVLSDFDTLGFVG